MKSLNELSDIELENGLRKIEKSLDGLLMRSLDRSKNISINILRKKDVSIFDRLVVSALMRSKYITKAYFDLILKSNYMASLHLIRLNLDNILRIYAGFISKDSDIFASKFIEGVEVRDLKDKKGKKMTDSYLVKELSKIKNIEWVENFYKEMSGFVHFSEKHYCHIFNEGGDAYLGDDDNLKISIEDRLEKINNMSLINEILFSQANSRIE